MVACLEAAVAYSNVDADALIARARGLRAPIGGHLTDDLLTELKDGDG